MKVDYLDSNRPAAASLKALREAPRVPEALHRASAPKEPKLVKPLPVAAQLPQDTDSHVLQPLGIVTEPSVGAKNNHHQHSNEQASRGMELPGDSIEHHTDNKRKVFKYRGDCGTAIWYGLGTAGSSVLFMVL